MTVVETPQPTPAPKDPEKPDEPKPTPPPAVREPGKTGVGILEGGFVLPAMLALCGATGAMFGLRKRKEDDEG